MVIVIIDLRFRNFNVLLIDFLLLDYIIFKWNDIRRFTYFKEGSHH